eukprot:6181264-Pleurochrysis_carterae.AAC.4
MLAATITHAHSSAPTPLQIVAERNGSQHYSFSKSNKSDSGISNEIQQNNVGAARTLQTFCGRTARTRAWVRLLISFIAQTHAHEHTRSQRAQAHAYTCAHAGSAFEQSAQRVQLQAKHIFIRHSKDITQACSHACQRAEIRSSSQTPFCRSRAGHLYRHAKMCTPANKRKHARGLLRSSCA